MVVKDKRHLSPASLEAAKNAERRMREEFGLILETAKIRPGVHRLRRGKTANAVKPGSFRRGVD